MKRITIAKILSLVGTALGCIGFFNLVTGAEITKLIGMCFFFAPMLALVSYCFCGFMKALGLPFSAAKWGFLVAPFPANLAAVLILFVLGILAVCFFPVVAVFKRAAELGS